jgi:uncharacterized protein
MAQHFVDSSALLKRYRRETGSAWMLSLSAQSERLFIARLAEVEVTAAIVRRDRESKQALQNILPALANLDNDIRREFRVLEFSHPLISRAIALSKAHALRAADAIQLAAALAARAELPEAVEYFLVSADDELNTAATAEGSQVENPNSRV